MQLLTGITLISLVICPVLSDARLLSPGLNTLLRLRISVLANSLIAILLVVYATLLLRSADLFLLDLQLPLFLSLADLVLTDAPSVLDLLLLLLRHTEPVIALCLLLYSDLLLLLGLNRTLLFSPLLSPCTLFLLPCGLVIGVAATLLDRHLRLRLSCRRRHSPAIAAVVILLFYLLVIAFVPAAAAPLRICVRNDKKAQCTE